MQLKIFCLFILLILSSCSGVKFLTNQNNKGELYSEDFSNLITNIKQYYRQGEIKVAFKMLKEMEEEKLSISELAFRRNVMGVMYFAEENFEQAIFNFNIGVTYNTLDKSLQAQLYLNLASSYFKLSLFEKSFEVSHEIKFEYLSNPEARKGHKLRYELSSRVDELEEEVEIKSLISYLGYVRDLDSLKVDSLYEEMIFKFFKFSQRERRYLLRSFDDENNLAAGYLSYLEVEHLYYGGKKAEAKELLRWLENSFLGLPELHTLVENFMFRMKSYLIINPKSIGVILPMSGDKKRYGERALEGMNVALKDVVDSYNIYVKDSKGSGAVGAHRVKEMIEKHNVSIIIGGLFSSEAIKEYQEAKKHGVFFISLSEIFIEKNMKDHLLLEIPGSVESLVRQIFNPKLLESMGKRGAIIYPRTKKGFVFRDEFWKMAVQNDIEVTGMVSYTKDTTDFRDTVKNLLGLKYIRARQEEYDLLKEIHSLEKTTSVRRVQTLKPQVDFDWIFIPSIPKKAIQLIPSFSYLDAFDLNIIGISSWKSNKILRESRKLGPLYYIGDRIINYPQSVVQNFVNLSGHRPNIVELRSFDSISIATNILNKAADFETRDQLDILIKSNNQLDGITGSWVLFDDIWLKNNTLLKIRRGKITPAKLEVNNI